MNEPASVRPHRPLIWPDFVYELKEFLLPLQQPVFIVGGAVRDSLLHRPLKDIDLTTPIGAVRLARQIANHFGGDIFVMDAERDVARVLLTTAEGALSIDVAGMRGAGLLDDLQDRDFTVNAMAVDAMGDLELLIDPLGGETDIRSKLLRRCSPSAVSSDPIRALRAVRQSLQLGLRIESQTLLDIREAAQELGRVSPERLRDEWYKLLALPRPAAALRIVDAIGLLRVTFPEVTALQGLAQSPAAVLDAWQYTLAVVEDLSNIMDAIGYHRTDNTASSFRLGMLVIQLDRYRKQLVEHLSTGWPNERTHQSLLILAALVHDVGRSRAGQDADVVKLTGVIAGEIGTRLRLSNSEVMRLLQIIQFHRWPVELDDISPLAIYRFWRPLGEAGVDVCLLALADYLGTHGTQLHQKSWLVMVERVRVLLEAWYEKHDSLVEPPPLLDGNQILQAFSLKPGRVIGELLEHVREAQVVGEVRSREEALEFVRSYLENDGHDR